VGGSRVKQKQDRPGLILDADVTIDYVKIDRSIISLAADHIGDLSISEITLQEVKDIGEDELIKLGGSIIRPSLDQLREAARISQDNPRLSFQDSQCFVIAKDHGWVCVTNEKPLGKYCREHGVQTMRGLRLMIDLVQKGMLKKNKAVGIANDIATINKFITEKIIRDFKSKLE